MAYAAFDTSDLPRVALAGEASADALAQQAGPDLALPEPIPVRHLLVALDGTPYAERAPNEKVAVDVAIGAAYAGRRAFATMKHVGLNVPT